MSADDQLALVDALVREARIHGVAIGFATGATVAFLAALGVLL